MISIERFDANIHGKELWDLYKGPEYKEFFRRVPSDYKIQDLMNLEATSQSVFFVLYYIGKPIGFACLTEMDPYGLSCHFGIMLQVSYQDMVVEGEKIAARATKAVLRHLFNTTHMHKVKFQCLAYREDLINTLEKGGFTKEAHLRESAFYKAKWEDEVLYSMLRDEFIQLVGL